MTTEKTLGEQIDEQVDYNLRTHELKQAHELLAEARKLMRRAELHLEHKGDTYADNVEAVVVNGLETVMWQIESAVRARKASQ